MISSFFLHVSFRLEYLFVCLGRLLRSKREKNLKPLLIAVKSCSALRLTSLNLLQNWTKKMLLIWNGAPAEPPSVKQLFWAPPLHGGDPFTFQPIYTRVSGCGSVLISW